MIAPHLFARGETAPLNALSDASVPPIPTLFLLTQKEHDMHRIDTPTAQKDKFGQGKNGFTNGDPTTGTPSTHLNSDIFDGLC